MFETIVITSNTYDESQPKYTWWQGLGLGLTGVLPQGHRKVTERSKQLKIGVKK